MNWFASSWTAAHWWRQSWFAGQEEAPAPEAPQSTVAPTYGEYRLSEKRHREFREFLEEGNEYEKRQRAKAEALERDRREAEAKEFEKRRRELERARGRREAEILKGLRAKRYRDNYPKALLAGIAELERAHAAGALSAESPTQGRLTPAVNLKAILTGEHSLQGVAAPIPYLTGRAALELEDDAIALALGMPELTEVLGEFVRI